ncbi:G protein-coupled receptor gpr1 [Exophiala xenobiotica]|uniref:G protein-coupled receptor gpr1 n=1 Tax=Lithohypha guttulata TaxID=1690604 RepID=A0ABR0KGC5_9EURO|nr:G protein-coupled receptor gpr1 [Lithohypha guttulata]KAK5310253.1 G protein-coupled receptor gpr1 [Exophiala xenobiotica]
MYTALYIYVTLKFRSFSNLQDSDSSTTPHSNSRRSSRRSSEDGIAPDEPDRPAETSKASRFNRPGFSRASSYNKEHPQLPVDPWDQVSFITSKPLRDIPRWQPGIQAADFAWIARDTRQQGAVSPPRTRSSSHQPAAPPLASRGVPDCMTMDSRYTGDTITNAPGADVPAQEEATAANKRTAPRTVPPNSHQLTQARTKDPLRRTRWSRLHCIFLAREAMEADTRGP